MIKNSIDFDYSLREINKELNIDIKPQDKLLDSKSFNNSMKNIETNLNKLYENFRHIENMNNYCKAFLSVKIDDYKTEAESILNLIEDIRDINKNMAYIDYEVPLFNSLNNLKDRDKSKIKECKLQNNLLILNNSIEKDVEFDSCTKKSLSIPYMDNLKHIKTEAYRTTYIEDNIVTGGMREIITIHFPAPTKINNIDIKVSNCTIENIIYKYINGTEEHEKKYTTGAIKDRQVTSISFDLLCKNYTHSVYRVDKNKMTEDTWSKIKEYEYAELANIETQMELSEFIEVIRDKESTVINSKPEPNANIINLNKYSYMFGIDSIKLKYVKAEKESCFISKDINIGNLKQEEYINIISEANKTEGNSIEYYILDGEKEVPLLSFNEKKVEDEKIFTNMSLRFNQGENNEVTIKNNGYVVDMSLDDAIKQTTQTYSVDYYPDTDICYSYTPINNTIKIKVIIRRFNDFAEMPYIKSIKVRKYGGAAPWIENL